MAGNGGIPAVSFPPVTPSPADPHRKAHPRHPGPTAPLQLDPDGLVAEEIHRLLGDKLARGTVSRMDSPPMTLRPSRVSFAFTSGCTLPAMRVPVMAL